MEGLFSFELKWIYKHLHISVMDVITWSNSVFNLDKICIAWYSQTFTISRILPVKTILLGNSISTGKFDFLHFFVCERCDGRNIELTATTENSISNAKNEHLLENSWREKQSLHICRMHTNFHAFTLPSEMYEMCSCRGFIAAEKKITFCRMIYWSGRDVALNSTPPKSRRQSQRTTM